MPIAIAAGAAMGGAFPRALDAQTHGDAVICINQLVYGNLWGAPGNLQNQPRARLDLQGYTGTGQMNLQVQVNGVGRPSTIACVLVDNTVRTVPPPSPRILPQQTEIVRNIKAALFNSLFAFENNAPVIWNVTGTPAN
jgi:hypothetical protein